MIEITVYLSTLHVPTGDSSDFRGCKYRDHDEGWLVYIDRNLTGFDFDRRIPLWLQPIYKYAQQAGAAMINFDSEAEEDSAFEVW